MMMMMVRMMRMMMKMISGRTWMVETLHLLRAGLVLDAGEEEEEIEGRSFSVVKWLNKGLLCGALSLFIPNDHMFECCVTFVTLLLIDNQ